MKLGQLLLVTGGMEAQTEDSLQNQPRPVVGLKHWGSTVLQETIARKYSTPTAEQDRSAHFSSAGWLPMKAVGASHDQATFEPAYVATDNPERSARLWLCVIIALLALSALA